MINSESADKDFLMCNGVVAFCPFEEKANLYACHYKAVVFVMDFISLFKKSFKM